MKLDQDESSSRSNRGRKTSAIAAVRLARVYAEIVEVGASFGAVALGGQGA